MLIILTRVSFDIFRVQNLQEFLITLFIIAVAFYLFIFKRLHFHPVIEHPLSALIGYHLTCLIIVYSSAPENHIFTEASVLGDGGGGCVCKKCGSACVCVRVCFGFQRAWGIMCSRWCEDRWVASNSCTRGKTGWRVLSDNGDKLTFLLCSFVRCHPTVSSSQDLTTEWRRKEEGEDGHEHARDGGFGEWRGMRMRNAEVEDAECEMKVRKLD